MNLDKLKNWKEKYKRGKGVDTLKINEIEKKFDVRLPFLYKDFLKESGVYCAAIVQGHRFEYLEQQQQEAQDLLKEYKLQNLIKKPFWVIADDGDSDAFWYFHLDEGDNPAIYRLSCMYYGEMDDKYTFGKVANSFQEWIEEAVERYEENPFSDR